MTHDEMIREYTQHLKNQLSARSELRLRELEAEAAKEHLRFEIENETLWMNPHYIGDPHIILRIDPKL